jgi:proline iminopeptidase
MNRWISFFLLAMCTVYTSCNTLTEPGVLVPPTADQDPLIPQITIQVAGHDRAVHVRTFGDPENPPLFMLHGSLADSRILLPLQELADAYFVVFWDQRGNGLSERITEDEITFDSMVEEINAMKARYAPHRKINLIGHSWGAMFAALYLARHPDRVNQVVLAEPAGLTGEITNTIKDQAMNLFTEKMIDMIWFNDMLSPRDHEVIDYKCLLVLQSAVRPYFCDLENLPPISLWRAGGYVEIIRNRKTFVGGEFKYNLIEGIENFPNKVLLLGTTCSMIGYDFQLEHHKPLFQQAEVVKIENAGHRMFTEQYDAIVAAIRSYLEEY